MGGFDERLKGDTRRLGRTSHKLRRERAQLAAGQDWLFTQPSTSVGCGWNCSSPGSRISEREAGPATLPVSGSSYWHVFAGQGPAETLAWGKRSAAPGTPTPPIFSRQRRNPHRTQGVGCAVGAMGRDHALVPGASLRSPQAKLSAGRWPALFSVASIQNPPPLRRG